MSVVSESLAFEHITKVCQKEMPDLLLISGPTGSGKSTISKMISEELGVSLLSLDNYFKNEDEMELVLPELNIRQWDSPDCYNWNVLIETLQDIFRKKIARIPIFSHELSRQNGWAHLRLQKTPLIVEGLYAMHPEILDTVQSMRLKLFSVFLNIPEEIRWQRKYNRDVLERDEDPSTLRIWFDSVIKPAEKQWINQQLRNADLVIVND
ncbi:MAG: AAA family ATPase [Candidatus Peregrinibacteria bacterium]